MIMMKQKKISWCQNLDFNNQYGWTLSQPVPYGGFNYDEDISMFTHDFIINCNKNSDLGCTFIVDVDYSQTWEK